MNAIEIKDITKNFSAVKALEHVSLAIEPHKIYGLLGRNGAGKTTLINLITNKLFPTEGEITVDEQSVIENDEALGKLCCMTEQNLCPEGMRVKKAFHWAAVFYPMFDTAYAAMLAKKFELDVNRTIKQLSTGYNSIFKLILAMASGASILIFDEPVLGLDANHRDLFYKELLALYAQHPCTVIISTHLIDEVAQVIEQAVILKDGRLVLNQPVEQLLARAHSVSGEAGSVETYTNGKQVIYEQSMGKYKTATVLDSDPDKSLADRLGLELSGVELQKLFIHLTNS